MSEPKFIPKLGQVDFTNIRWAPVINCVVYYKGKILLVQRSKDLKLYPGYWNGISGFLDDQKNLMEKVYEELLEEIGITKKQVLSIKLGNIFHQEEPKYNKTWIVHPILVHVTTDKVKLDWESQIFKWVTIKEAKKMNLLLGFVRVIKSFKL